MSGSVAEAREWLRLACEQLSHQSDMSNSQLHQVLLDMLRDTHKSDEALQMPLLETVGYDNFE
ncbi:MAG: hypothetical protein MHM6MM_008735, partial [Cercozoa sp. M6MM]